MADPLPIDPQQSAPLGIQGGANANTPAKQNETRANSVEFRAMLERLETRANDLAQESKNVEGPDELGRAVDTARASLEEALSLKDQLLEAYRQSEQQSGTRRGREAG